MDSRSNEIELKTFADYDCPQGTAPVEGFARSFIDSSPIQFAKVKLPNGKIFYTDENGKFGPFPWPINTPITLTFSKEGFRDTQSATVIVPPEGLISAYNNITFQVPSLIAYYAFSKLTGLKSKEIPNTCHVAATVTAFNKTLDDIPQGVADVIVEIIPPPSVTEKKFDPFYFGIFTNPFLKFLKHKTNPLARITKTSEDGGVLFYNIPPSDEPYTMYAYKDGMEFRPITFYARANQFINLCPPHGPTALQPMPELLKCKL